MVHTIQVCYYYCLSHRRSHRTSWGGPDPPTFGILTLDPPNFWDSNMGPPHGTPHGTPMGPPTIWGLPVRYSINYPPSNSRNLIDYPLPSKSCRKTPQRLPPLEIVPENTSTTTPPRNRAGKLHQLPPLEFTELPSTTPPRIHGTSRNLIDYPPLPPRNRAGKLHVPFLTDFASQNLTSMAKYWFTTNWTLPTFQPRRRPWS